MARTLGATVGELQQRMSAREFQYWIEYHKQEPFGDDWMQAATIAAATVNVWSRRDIKPERFIPRLKQVQARDPKDLEREMMAFARKHNNRDEKRKARKGA